MKVFLLLSLLSLCNSLCIGQADPIKYSLYLIGNTGVDTIPSEAMQLLAFECFDDSASTVILLGDNVFNDGLNPNHSVSKSYESARKLISQFELFVGYQGAFYLILGDRDWSHGKSSGLKAVKSQAQITNDWFEKNSIVRNRKTGIVLPEAGYPGPVYREESELLDVIFLDSQWFIHKGLFKPRMKASNLTFNKQKKYSFMKLDSLLAEGKKNGRVQVVAAHHPIYSNGRHIHTNEPLRSLIEYTPLHIFGLLGLNRYFRQDLVHPPYRRYRSNVNRVLKKYPGTIYVSAHEHAMQAFEQDSVYYLVSGSGAYTEELDRYRFIAFFMDDLQEGFFKISFHESGRAYIRALGVNDRGEYWRKELFQD